MKLFFYDLETTGVKHWRHGIHQLSGCIEIDGVIKEKFDFKICPNPKCDIEHEALKVGGVTREQVLTYPSMEEAYKNLIIMLTRYVDKYNKKDKFFLIGFNNASFDNQFLRAFFLQNKDDYFGSWFWADTHDVMVLASNHLKDHRAEMENFKLATVAKFMGIEVNETLLHDAIYDILLTRTIYHIVNNPLL